MFESSIRSGAVVRSRFDSWYGRKTATALIAGAIGACLAPTAPAVAANLACKPDVKVVNRKATAIKVLRFAYTTDGKEYHEGLANKKLAHDEPHTWKKQKLQHVADGNPITATRVEYRDDTSGAKNPSDPWGPARWSNTVKETGDCDGNRTYAVLVD